MKFVSIITALVVLIFAIIQLGLDLINFFLNGVWHLETLNESFERIIPGLVMFIKDKLELSFADLLWDPIMLYLLSKPTFFILLLLSMGIFIMIKILNKKSKKNLSEYFY